MSARKVVLGVDGGTESIRAEFFAVENGEVLSFAAEPYGTEYPQPGWAEQNPEDWWRCMGSAVKAAKAKLQGPYEVIAMSVDTTCCTVVALDDKGAPLRPCLLWMDMRSAKEAAIVASSGDPALRVNSNGAGPVSAEWMVPKSLWLKNHDRATYDKATFICEYQDFINHRLTGRMCASTNNAAIRWHWHAGVQPPASLLKKLGLEDLLSKWPQEAVAPGALVGPLSAAAAEHLGLRSGTPVAQGGADAFIGMVGLGVVSPGKMALLTGSSHLHLGVAPAAMHGAGIWGTYENCVVCGQHVVEGGQTSTGSVLAWFRRLVGGVDYKTLDAEAAAVPIGCEGLVAQEHLQGNRTPHTDPLSRGALVGLTLRHGRGHIFRALMEGVAFGTRLIIETMRARGFVPVDITVAGGAVNSPLWLQIHADVTGLPLVLTKCSDAPALGCAVLAAVAVGAHPDIAAGAAKMVQVERVIQPNMEAHAAYAPFFEAYKAMYGAVKPISAQAADGAEALAAAGGSC